jgi:hypothetical protein
LNRKPELGRIKPPHEEGERAVMKYARHVSAH